MTRQPALSVWAAGTADVCSLAPVTDCALPLFSIELSLRSMAAPHVTGAVAVYLETHPTASPAEVMSALVSASSSGTLTDSSMLPGTPDKLLFTGALAT